MKKWVGGGAEFFQFVTAYERSSWRWECQGTYHMAGEREPIQRWREGSINLAFLDTWVATIRRLRAEGKTFERVRMLTEPLTEYLQWLASFTHVNIEAGEDIRWIQQARARELGMPTYDFYLLDNVKVAIMHFDGTGVAGADVTDDPAVVADHRRYRDLVWPIATPHHTTEYSPSTRSP